MLGVASLPDHPRTHRIVVALVDDDESTRGTVVFIRIDKQRLSQLEAYLGDIVHGQFFGRHLFQRVHIQTVVDGGQFGFRVAGGVADQVGAGAVERGFCQPADGGGDFLDGSRRFAGFDDHVAARRVDLVGEQQSDRLLGNGFTDIDTTELHGLDGGFQTVGQYGDLVADLDRAGFDAAHEAAVVVQLGIGGILRAADVLHREAELLGVLAVGGRGGFKDFEQGRAFVPVQAVATVDDHVAVERRHGQETEVDDADLGRELKVIRLDLLVGFLRVVDQIQRVEGDDQMRDADQRRQLGVAAGLGQHALARVDQDDGQVGGRGGG